MCYLQPYILPSKNFRVSRLIFREDIIYQNSLRTQDLHKNFLNVFDYAVHINVKQMSRGKEAILKQSKFSTLDTNCLVFSRVIYGKKQNTKS
jgi:hypothetical protein